MDWDTLFLRELAALEDRGLRRSLRPVDGPQGGTVRIGEREVLCLCSNNYLGLASHPALIEAAAETMRTLGIGAGASRLVSGSMRIHHDLEERLAAFKGTEAALLFPTGYHANLGTIAALVGRGDVVFSDELNHASIVDGCRLSRARIEVYRHLDLEDLERRLQSAPERRRLIVTDALFSMDGDVAPLEHICELAERYGAMVMVDEAHSAGVFGPRGAGLAAQHGLTDRITVHMGTLGKAFGSAGAYVAGSRALIDLLINRARTVVFTTALPVPVVAAAAAALTLIERGDHLRRRVLANARYLREALSEAGFRLLPGDSQILPVIVGAAPETMALSSALLDEGVLAQGIRPPTVPEGTSRIRVTVMATHTEEDLRAAVEAFRRARTRIEASGRTESHA